MLQLNLHLYNEVLGLTIYFFLTPVVLEYKAIWKQNLDIS